MSIANLIDDFFKKTGQTVFIEAEGLESTIQRFIAEYNSKFSETITASGEGIICLPENKNKWGLELRCYFSNANEFPDMHLVTENPYYRPGYQFRFNNNDIIWQLFELGYRIGNN